jgi:hypothetical protein
MQTRSPKLARQAGAVTCLTAPRRVRLPASPPAHGARAFLTAMSKSPADHSARRQKRIEAVRIHDRISSFLALEPFRKFLFRWVLGMSVDLKVNWYPGIPTTGVGNHGNHNQWRPRRSGAEPVSARRASPPSAARILEMVRTGDSAPPAEPISARSKAAPNRYVIGSGCE